MHWALYPILTTATYYLLARASITRWLWETYPHWLASFMNCAACSGFWYGVALGFLGRWAGWSFLGLPPTAWYTPWVIGAGALVWTPILAYAHAYALEGLG